MGIHYDYKSIRGEKAMKKEAKKRARLEERRARRSSESQNSQQEKKKMHDIDKPITLEDLTNPDSDKDQLQMSGASAQKDARLIIRREIALKKNLKKRKKFKQKVKKKHVRAF